MEQKDEFGNLKMMRKVLTSKVKTIGGAAHEALLNRAKTSKESAHYVYPDYDYNVDQEAYLEEREIQRQVKIMINDAKKVS